MISQDVLIARVAAALPALNVVLNHLWQSTVFAGLAALLALALGKEATRARYHLWLAASLKFLIPFSLLIGAGSWLAPARGPAIGSAGLTFIMENISQPFARAAIPVSSVAAARAPVFHAIPCIALAVWYCGFAGVLLVWVTRWSRVAAAVRLAAPFNEGRELDALRRAQRAAGLTRRIELRSSTAAAEPGVFGVFRPVILLPSGIADRLDSGQLVSIITHELCHIRRNDNLIAAIHMLVEAIFWFHPLVWWLGALLVGEREHACDEEVVLLGNEPAGYAEGILKVCQYYLESPLVCVSGITGSNLTRRIEGIMTRRKSNRLTSGKKLLLAAAGIAAVAIPVTVGLMHPQPGRAQSPAAPELPHAFDVASIKPSPQGQPGPMIQMSPHGTFTAKGIDTKTLIGIAYEVQDFQISGAPGWLGSDRFEINAKTEGDVNLNMAQYRPLLQALLADRFKLTFHRDTKELPIYALVVGKNGPKLKESDANARGPMMRLGRGQLNGTKVQLDFLAKNLSRQLGRTVLNKTGLTGNYDFTLEWTPEPGEMMGPGPVHEAPPPSESTGPSIFTALQEQLGLKLESQRGPVEILIIDRVERPSEN
jgi:uncharacterized protein (TIGR03435 family)